MTDRLAKDYPCALITGASSGIGEAFAEALAAAGCDLVLVARSADRLEAIAARLRASSGRRIEVIPADLSRPSPAAALAANVAARGLRVDLLVNNAGFGTVGAFTHIDALQEQREIALNTAAVVDLCHAFVPEMAVRGRGAVINIASLAGFQAMPFMSVYAATKAFVLSFSLGLWGEVRDKGVHVLCVCPGPVDTPFFEATGKSSLRETVPAGMMWTAEAIVSESLAALRRRRAVLIPGAANRAAALGGRLLPRPLLSRLVARAMRR